MVVCGFEIVRLMSNLDEAKHDTKVVRFDGKFCICTNSSVEKFSKKKLGSFERIALSCGGKMAVYIKKCNSV